MEKKKNLKAYAYASQPLGSTAIRWYSKQKRYKTLLNVAVPSGMWQNAENIICNDEDRKYLRKIRKEYKNLVRNIWNPFDKNHEKILGCTTVNRLYITPIGDVLVCPYVHIKIGNIFEQSLKEIVDHGFSIKYFRNHSDLCLAGEDKEFISKFMTKSGQTIFKPALAKDIFSSEDFIEGPVAFAEKRLPNWKGK